MIRLLFVGDGERDHASLPPLVATILEVTINEQSEFRAWKSFRDHKGRGFARKLLYATAHARDAGLPGVVAVVDADTAAPRTRLKKLQEGRDAYRSGHPPFPTAIGEARPHFDAWVLDDSQAVRTALDLGKDAVVPSVAESSNPKADLNRLISMSQAAVRPESDDARTLSALSKTAAAVDPTRCPNAKSTGFEAFAKEVDFELRGPAKDAR